MDLGIRGRRALVVGGSGGLGAASAEYLAEAGVSLHLMSRNADALAERAADFSARFGVEVETTAGDMVDPADREAVATRCSDADILVLSGAWPQLKDTSEPWAISDWESALDIMLMPQIDLISRLYPGMVERGFGRIVVITSRLIKDPELELAMPAVARLGLTGYLKALSRDVARHGVTVNSMLPGVFGTETQRRAIAETARQTGETEAEVITRRMIPTPAGRLGEPSEFGSLCAYLCSAHAGFLTGQALVMDGGAHTGIW